MPLYNFHAISLYSFCYRRLANNKFNYGHPVYYYYYADRYTFSVFGNVRFLKGLKYKINSYWKFKKCVVNWDVSYRIVSVRYVFVCIHIYIGIYPIYIYMHVCISLMNLFGYRASPCFWSPALLLVYGLKSKIHAHELVMDIILI